MQRGYSISFALRRAVATPISVKRPDFDIHDEKVIYLDLAQQEGSVDSSTALTMQLLISLVYERAKISDTEVVFYIDEARYIMQDAASLAFLETVFRHHRHHDLSIRLVTQTVDEFFEHAESEAILDQCVPSSSSIASTGWTRRGPPNSG